MARVTLLVCILLISAVYGTTKTDYLAQRQDFINAERHQGLGGDVKFTPKEAAVNAKLVQLKSDEIKKYRDQGNGEYFPPVNNFMKSRSNISQSEVYQIIRAMPKGAALHVHDQAIADLRWIIANLTYREDCWACYTKTWDLKMGFFDKAPQDPDCEWFRVNKKRRSLGNASIFDEELYRKMSMDDGKVLSNQNDIWRKFLSCFTAIEGLFMSEIGFDAIFTRGLQDFYDDNVQYMEIRGLFPKVSRSDGTFFEPDWLVKAYKDSTERFTMKNPDFVGAKNVITAIRALGADDVRAVIDDARRWKQAYPDQIAGFDLVAQEDLGHPLIYFIDDLLEATDLTYIFHAGETNWIGQDVDENLVDAVLLNTTRIGHGYAISHHPKVLEHVMKNGIAIEVNPISNQVLGLVPDLRNHPAATYMAMGLPVVISSDDPVLWGSSPMSHDFYEAFMGFTGGWGDLGTLKTLALNSIKYSSMSAEEKEKTTTIWQRKWEEFLDFVVQTYHLQL